MHGCKYKTNHIDDDGDDEDDGGWHDICQIFYTSTLATKKSENLTETRVITIVLTPQNAIFSS